MRFCQLSLILACVSVGEAASAAPDALVVCPAEFRGALAPWENYRRGQGHELVVIEPPATTEELHAKIRHATEQGNLKYVVLVGDVPGPRLHPGELRSGKTVTVPTEYAKAEVNVRWGSELTIATDQMFADTDGDQVPDVAVGRIPADSPAELAAVIRKILRYEEQADQSSWRRRIDVVAGVGGFGVVADTLIESAGRRVIESAVPASFEVQAVSASPTNPLSPPPDEFTSHVCRQISAGTFAWIYMGHGLPTQLDLIETSHGPRPILSVDDMPQLRCGAQCPLAVLIACYTGAFDARQDCLAERLVVCDEGPIAVIAATRVTMPYGNTVFGCELLRSCFSDRPGTLGELWTIAQRRTLAVAPDDALRNSLDTIAQAITPPQNPNGVQGADLFAERREHVLMYHLLGDPLLRLQLPSELQLTPTPVAMNGNIHSLSMTCESNFAGQCTVELLPVGVPGSPVAAAIALTTAINAGEFQVTLPLPLDFTGPCTVRAFVSGEHKCAAGAASITLPPPPLPAVSQAAKERRRN